MYLSTARIFNYKSFSDSEDISLTSGINVIVGQNNAGKSGLLEALALNFSSVPHESLTTKPQKDVIPNKTSLAAFQITLSSHELKKILGLHKMLAFPASKTFTIEDSELSMLKNGQTPERILNLLNTQLEKENKLNGIYNSTEQRIDDLYLSLDDNNEWSVSQLDVSFDAEKNIKFLAHDFDGSKFNQIQLDSDTAVYRRLVNDFIANIFKFSPKRIDLEASFPVEGFKLLGDCSNLAGLINNLSSENRDMFEELLGLLTSVIPPVKDLFTKRQPHSSGIGYEYLLKISAYSSKLRRSDLAKYLSDSGTGIGQVLAILFVIVTSEYPRVILIDEIQSFLHPGAVKKLMEIFNNYPIKHQYILTTHSAEVINNSHPSNIVFVDIKDGVSTAISVNTKKSGDMQRVFNSLGMKISDYTFGHHFLWVEGETEKEILPLLLDNRDYINIFVVKSGIIYKNRKESIKLACDLVRQLSTGENTRARTVSIVFDKESLKEFQVQELQKIAGGILHFLPRRMTENYLIHPRAVSDLLNEIAEEVICDENEASDWFKAKFNIGWIDDNDILQTLPKKEWLTRVHGANLLHKFFAEKSENRIDYNSSKKQFGYELATRILEFEPNFLDDLRDFYSSILG